ncbi:MAG: ArsA family ATPase [Prochloron sp. SP5CPC1]|nr:ArsA family ATPase [Candidatus Paraprochloron terpiosi SP5CPC1]
MAKLLTFLGKGGTGRTTVTIAAAKQLANLGSRVLLVGGDPSPAFGLQLGLTPDREPQEIAANLSVVQLQGTALLEQGWEDLKKFEAEYLKSPTLKNVYGQELGILPGMDSALALYAIREYRERGKYDIIIYDGSGDLTTLRMLGTPEIFSWYIRRFRQIFQESDLGKAISPFIQPVTSAIFNTSWTADDFGTEPRSNNMLQEAQEAMADPKQVAAYLVTDRSPTAIATAKYLWGSAQQIGLTVGGVLLNRSNLQEDIKQEFTPLPVTSLPTLANNNWQPLIDALPNFRQGDTAPKPITVDIAKSQVKVFLPGFAKKDVKLTQYGPEITVEAGNQRRNILLPTQLRGRSVKGAKFSEGYLIITL